MVCPPQNFATVRHTRSSSTSDCVIPLRRSAFGLSFFSVKALTSWNTLPEEIRVCIDLFKLKLKSYLKLTQFCDH